MATSLLELSGRKHQAVGAAFVSTILLVNGNLKSIFPFDEAELYITVLNI